jgi:predicted PurR-regulated permease PerM
MGFMPIKIDSPLARRVATFAFLFFIFGLTFWVLSPFLAPLAWAGILAYATWPLHQWLYRRLSGRDNIAALLMTLGVAATLLLPMVCVLIILVADLAAAAAAFKQLSLHGLPPLPSGVRGWPGSELIAAQYQRVQATRLGEGQSLRST